MIVLLHREKSLTIENIEILDVQLSSSINKTSYSSIAERIVCNYVYTDIITKQQHVITTSLCLFIFIRISFTITMV
jgi:hypothetical protein